MGSSKRIDLDSEGFSIGVIGGAGPIAGTTLCTMIFKALQIKFKCKNDGDFPRLVLLNTPFSNMLETKAYQAELCSDAGNEEKITQQLDDSIKFLKRNNCNIIAIACNTLHGYLQDKHNDDITIINIVKETLLYSKSRNNNNSLLLCTAKSILKSVYNVSEFIRPDCNVQVKIDNLIASILGDKELIEAKNELQIIIDLCKIKNPEIDSVILGCSELSVVNFNVRDKLHYSNIDVLCPLEIVSNKLAGMFINIKKAGKYN